MFYPQDVVEEIRMNNDIVDLVSSYVQLKQKGSSYFGLCPFHNEKSPSFSVSPDKQIFHCFGCGATGNAIGFVMQMENYDFPQAIKFMADRIRYQLPEKSFSGEAVKNAEIKEKLYEINTHAARFFYNNLMEPQGEIAKKYLDSRGIQMKVRKKFGLGYSQTKWDALFNHLSGMGYDLELLIKSGLFVPSKNGGYRDKFLGRLMFPIFNAHGKTVGFGGRILEQGEPKYLNSPETPIFEKSKNLYGIQLARKSREKDFLLVEGYMDVISLYQAGIHNVVAALGTAFNEEHARVIKKYADSVTILFDSDDAGTKAALRAVNVLTENGLTPKVLQVRDAKDPDEFINKFGVDAFREIQKQALSHVAFQVENIKKQYDLHDAQNRVQFISETAGVLAKLGTEVERESYTKEVADITGISETAIYKEVDAKVDKSLLAVNPIKKPGYEYIKQNKTNEKGIIEARKSIVLIISKDERVYQACREILAPEELDDPIYIRALKIIYDFREKGRNIYLAELLNYFEDIAEQKTISDIFNSNKDFSDIKVMEKEFNGSLKKIKAYNWTKRKAAANDAKELKKLFENKRKIDGLYITLTNG